MRLIKLYTLVISEQLSGNAILHTTSLYVVYYKPCALGHVYTVGWW